MPVCGRRVAEWGSRWRDQSRISRPESRDCGPHRLASAFTARCRACCSRFRRGFTCWHFGQIRLLARNPASVLPSRWGRRRARCLRPGLRASSSSCMVLSPASRDRRTRSRLALGAVYLVSGSCFVSYGIAVKGSLLPRERAWGAGKETKGALCSGSRNRPGDLSPRQGRPSLSRRAPFRRRAVSGR